MKFKLLITLITLLFFVSNLAFVSKSFAHGSHCTPARSCSTCNCNSMIEDCQDFCIGVSTTETGSSSNPNTTIGHITNEFKKHQTWIIEKFFKDATTGDPTGLLAAMQLMAAQFASNAAQKTQAIGGFFDAKHQLESQALFADLKLDTHQNYSPSAELCEVGTMSQSLMGSQRNAEMTAKVLSKQTTQRQVLSKNKLSERGYASNSENRLVNFIKVYCDKKDNNNLLDRLCMKGNPDPLNYNKDINYTKTIDAPKNLDLDFVEPGEPSIDERAIIALSQNLFGHRLFPYLSPNKFVKEENKPSFKGAATHYLDARAVMAKRSVATNGFNAIAALKTKGTDGAQPFIYSLLQEMAGTEYTEQEIIDEIGLRPSYDAQMDILTKTLYQRPEFYSDLYDKPANVLRKNVALQAATLMQKRDLYQSYLRSEMSLAVMLETLLMKEQDILELNLPEGINQ